MGVKRRKPAGRQNSSRGTHGRRKVPPAATGQEAAYFQRVKDARSPVVVHLVNGSQVEGVVEYFDRDMIKITRPEGPHVFVRKADIRYMYEDRSSDG
jgi:sRNA-binding regulator protein Hfq